ncbi:MAG: transketolase [Candidatus Marinimicrobia bacterium]|nr:transketolase [Candidatus Neomarinimicrobiota bacterium]MCF7827733.1 transketolase [Candidatus Neomarinimicrobiota bacterium]MCF7881212.1 transketolase [Candidatus Neomarinimicrobiota bacterium]
MATSDISTLSINTIRTLAMDGVQKAGSGHPGMPMGCAPIAYLLYTQYMKHTPEVPDWPDRDRFVLSAGHGSMLLYSMLHLTGYGMPLDQLKQFRQLGSKTAGHPEYWDVPGIETTTGPLGQGFTNGIGMALAAKHLAAKFNKDDYPIIDHNIYAICSDGDLMEGISSEAASLAGHLGLDDVIYLYDDNKITIDGSTDLAFSEDVPTRFESYDWHVQVVDDVNNLDALSSAIETAKEVKGKPHLIAVRTHIGYGSPNQQDTSAAHGSPLGEEEVALTKENLGWDPEKHFYVPDEVSEHIKEQVTERAEAYGEWQEMFDSYREEYPELASEFERRMRGSLPEDWDKDLPVFSPEDGRMATRKASGATIQPLSANIPELIGGSADLEPSNKTYIDAEKNFARDAYDQRNLHFGVREHAMSSIVSGMSLTKGVRPYGATFLIFSDYLRPTLRLAAMMGLPNIYVFTHDSIGVGEDGPTHQPIEQVASLRAIPNFLTLRPADANEVVECWKIALEQTDRPTAFALTRQGLPIYDRSKYAAASNVRKGGYVMNDSGDDPEIIFLASGSEVELALGAQDALAEEGVDSRVVNMCSWELFDEQTDEYRESVLPRSVDKRVVIEAGRRTGWDKYAGWNSAFITMETYGTSAPGQDAFKHFGFTVENVVENAKSLL